MDSKLKLRRPSMGGRLSFVHLDNIAAKLAFQQLHATAWVLIKNKRLSLMTEIDLFER